MMTKTQARIAFVDWLQKTHPQLAQAAIAHADAPGLNSGLGAETSWWQKLASGAAALGTTYLALKNQRDAMKINLARAEQGLEPIDAAMSAPVVRTQVDIDPAIAQKIAGSIGGGINTGMLAIAGLGLIALLFLMKK